MGKLHVHQKYGKPIVLEENGEVINAETTVRDVKGLLSAATGMPMVVQILEVDGSVLENDVRLSDVGVIGGTRKLYLSKTEDHWRTGRITKVTSDLKVSQLYGLLGEEKILEISRGFYRRLWECADPAKEKFCKLFKNHATLETAILNQQGFFIQRFGGPSMYGGLSKDSALIRKIHTSFRIVPSYVHNWLDLFADTLDSMDLGPRSTDVRSCLLNWAQLFAESVVNHTEQGGPIMTSAPLLIKARPLSGDHIDLIDTITTRMEIEKKYIEVLRISGKGILSVRFRITCHPKAIHLANMICDRCRNAGSLGPEWALQSCELEGDDPH